MRNRKRILGILAAALVFGVTLTGCEDPNNGGSGGSGGGGGGTKQCNATRCEGSDASLWCADRGGGGSCASNDRYKTCTCP